MTDYKLSSEKVKCGICSSSDKKLLFSVYNPGGSEEKVKITCYLFECKNCRIVYTWTTPGNNKLGNLYHDFYYGSGQNVLSNFFNYFFFLDRIRKLSNYAKKGRILDFGCGNGEFLSQIKKYAKEIYGVEPYPPNNILIDRNKTKKSLDDFVFQEKYFDLITFWQVFEHLENPKSTLVRIRNLLKDQGTLF